MKTRITVLVLLVATLGVGVLLWDRSKYQVASSMNLPLREFSTAEYPEDPAERSLMNSRYRQRTLTLIQKDERHFDFVLESKDPAVAKIVFKNVDAGLFATSQPEWTRQHEGNQLIALIDREWSRQQVSFKKGNPHLEVTGGDGYEATNIFTADLAKNCLNAGLWEIQLTFQERNNKALYYHAWFTFPLGHYRKLVEANSGIVYSKFWRRLEHWVNPAGATLDLAGLRKTVSERTPAAVFPRSERVFAGGEQKRKMRCVTAENIRTWGDYFDGRDVCFATFIKPGRYSVQHPWKHQYWRIGDYQRTILRDVISPVGTNVLQELELVFRDTRTGETNRLFIGGFDAAQLPQLPIADYSKGFYRPMGISVPPFFQAYEELEANLPWKSPYYSFIVDSKDAWINHHELSVDGPVMHRDEKDPNLLHLYLLSYERHALVAHFLIPLSPERSGRVLQAAAN